MVPLDARRTLVPAALIHRLALAGVVSIKPENPGVSRRLHHHRLSVGTRSRSTGSAEALSMSSI